MEACLLNAGEREVTLHFIIKDTGIGIAAEQRQTIFEAFTQVDASTTRRYGGTGLGLAIASQLIALMGGRIWVESEVGCGSAFHFTAQFPTPAMNAGARPEALPKAVALDPLNGSAAHELPPGSGQSVPGVPDKGRMRILLADDSLVSQCLIVRLLERDGHTVVTARTGSEALATFDSNSFDLFLLDLCMPEMDGYEVASAIREREARDE